MLLNFLENSKGKRLEIVVNEFDDVDIYNAILECCDSASIGISIHKDKNIIELANS